MKEEIKQILKMVEDKKISAEEAEKLIESIDEGQNAESINKNEFIQEPKFLRIHVVDDDDKVDIKLPISMIEVGMKLGMNIGPKFSPEMEKLDGIDINGLMAAIKEGARGKIVDIKTDDEIVEIYVE